MAAWDALAKSCEMPLVRLLGGEARPIPAYNSCGLGIIGDLVVGILGAFIAAWLLPKLGIRLGTGIVRQIIDATLGAVILLALVRLVRRL